MSSIPRTRPMAMGFSRTSSRCWNWSMSCGGKARSTGRRTARLRSALRLSNASAAAMPNWAICGARDSAAEPLCAPPGGSNSSGRKPRSPYSTSTFRASGGASRTPTANAGKSCALSAPSRARPRLRQGTPGCPRRTARTPLRAAPGSSRADGRCPRRRGTRAGPPS